MLNAYFKKKFINALLDEWYHKAEAEKGVDVQYHEKSASKANLIWNELRKISDDLLGTETGWAIRIEARKIAEENFANGITYID